MAQTRTHTEDAVLNVWPPVLAALAMSLGLALVALSGTVNDLVALWANSDAYGHGFFIAPIAAYLIWTHRRRLALLVPRPAPVGLVMILAACLTWLIGQAAGIALISQLAFVAVLQGLVLAVLGWQVAKGILFPLLYLYLMVPFGDFLIPFLQDLTAVAVVKSLRIFGIPVFIDGILLSIPSGSFEIAEACAGLRFMIAVVALGLVYAHLVYRTLWRRVAFMVLAIIVTIVANSLRALGIVLLAYATDHEVAIGADHLVYGWVFLSLVMLVLFLLGLTFRDPDTESPAGAPIEPARAPELPNRSKAKLLTSVLGGLLLVFATSSYGSRITGVQDHQFEVDLEAPSIAPPWVRQEVPRTDWFPVYLNADREILASYRSEDGLADLYVAYYVVQSQGAEVVNAGNKLAADPPWIRLQDIDVDLEIAGEDMSGMGTIVQDAAGRKRLVVRRFWVAGEFTASPQMAKLLQIRSVILDRERAAAAVLLSAPFDEDVESALGTLRSFLAALPTLGPTLAEASSTEVLSGEPSSVQ